MSEKFKVTATFNVNLAQAIALKSFFEKWEFNAAIGASRHVSFYVDGDGDFHPHIVFKSEKDLSEYDWVLPYAEVEENKFDYGWLMTRIENNIRENDE